MVPIENKILFLIIIINIIGISLIIAFAYIEIGNRKTSENISKQKFNKFNLRGSKLNNYKINFSFNIGDKFDMNKINENGNLRSLEEVENKYVQIIILILSVISTFFIINLILSINYENNSNLKEIFLIPNLNSSRDNSDSNKTKSNENIFEVKCENDCNLFSLVISLVILLFRTIQKKMGKKIQHIAL